MKKQAFGGLAFLLIALFSVSGVYGDSIRSSIQGNDSKYGYLVVPSEMSTQPYIQVVDALTGMDQQQIAVPVPVNWNLTFPFSLSPDGRWLVYVIELTTNTSIMTEIRLLDLTSQTVMIIAPTPSLSFSAVDQIIWSPNSQYIAFNLINWTPYAFVPTVYSIVDTTLSPIINADPNAKQLSWSEDSNYISAAVSVLGSDTIEIYERATASLIETYTLPNTPFRSIVSCAHVWSPDSNYIAFYTTCKAILGSLEPPSAAPQELYILSRNQGTFTLITDYTLVTQGLDDYFLVYYSPYWVDNDTLLTGVVHLGDFNTAIRNMETIVYNVDTGTISVLRTENIRNWTPNPHYSEIAFESVSSYDISSYNPTNTSGSVVAGMWIKGEEL